MGAVELLLPPVRSLTTRNRVLASLRLTASSASVPFRFNHSLLSVLQLFFTCRCSSLYLAVACSFFVRFLPAHVHVLPLFADLLMSMYIPVLLCSSPSSICALPDCLFEQRPLFLYVCSLLQLLKTVTEFCLVQCRAGIILQLFHSVRFHRFLCALFFFYFNLSLSFADPTSAPR